ERCDDVREDVCDLITHGQKNHDDDDRHEDQDQRVFDHSLAVLFHARSRIRQVNSITSFSRGLPTFVQLRLVAVIRWGWTDQAGRWLVGLARWGWLRFVGRSRSVALAGRGAVLRADRLAMLRRE